jgi:small GTP-binding protein
MGETGKSSLTVQFVDGHFVESYYPTIENTFSKIIKHKGQEYATEIIDTAGQVSRQVLLEFCFSFGLDHVFEKELPRPGLAAAGLV